MFDGDEIDDEDDVPIVERVDDMESRLEALESTLEHRSVEWEDSTVRGLSLGYGMGMMLAIVLSWSRNATILWCIIHGLLSWLYVLYFALTR